MKRLHLMSLAVPAVLLATAAGAAAQGLTPEVFNAIELRQLVASAEPGDHARLGTHFAALAGTYADAAARHTAMSKAFGGNAPRAGGASRAAGARDALNGARRSSRAG